MYGAQRKNPHGIRFWARKIYKVGRLGRVGWFLSNDTFHTNFSQKCKPGRYWITETQLFYKQSIQVVESNLEAYE